MKRADLKKLEKKYGMSPLIYDERDIGGAFREDVLNARADIWRKNWGRNGRHSSLTETSK